MNKLLAVLLCSTLFPAGLFGAETRVMTWKDCQNAALQNNPVLAGYRRSLESARYSYYASRNQDLPFPGISASHSYTRSGGVNSATSDSFGLSLSASETLFSVRSFNDLIIQNKSIEKADLDLRSSLASTRKNLMGAFVNLIYSQEKISMMEKILDIRRKSAEMISLQYESGRESFGNHKRTEAQLAQAEADLLQAKRDLITAQRNLAVSLGMDNFVNLVASGTLSVPGMMTGVNIDEASLSTIDTLTSKKSVEIYEMKVKQAGADAYPTLSASQGLNWHDVSELPGNRAWSLGLTLSWPMFSNGPTYYKNNKASATSLFEKAKADYRNTLLNAKYNLQSGLAALETDISGVHTSALMLEASRLRYEESEIQYLAGTLSFQTWQDVEQELVSAEKSYLSSLQSVNSSRINLDNLFGIPLGD